MIDERNYRITVASVPQPRKNKRVIKGKFNIMDFLIIVPAIGIFVALLLTGSWPFWVTIIILVALIVIVGALIWPLSFLGKEKLYIYAARAISFAFTKQRYGRADQPEASQRAEQREKSQGPTGRTERNPEASGETKGRPLPPDLIERLRRKRRAR